MVERKEEEEEEEEDWNAKGRKKEAAMGDEQVAKNKKGYFASALHA